MAKNSVTKRFLDGDIWTCPAGVTSVVVAANNYPFIDISSGLSRTIGDPMVGFSTSKQSGEPIYNPNPRSPYPVFNFGSFNGLGWIIDNQNRLYTWAAVNVQLGGWGDLVARSSPTLVVGGIAAKYFSATSGGQTSLILSTSGQLYTWGTAFGYPGSGDSVSRSSPLLMSGTSGLSWRSTVFDISFSESKGITTTGQMYGWGTNSFGGIGDGTLTTRLAPTLTAGGYTWRVGGATVSTASSTAFGITTTNQLYMWGSNGASSGGSLGVGDLIPRSSPVLVLGGISWKYVKNTSWTSTMGLSTLGQIYIWGNSPLIAGGDGSPHSSPVLISGGILFKNFVDGAVNNAPSTVWAGLSTTGGLYTWGTNTNGNLGTNDVINKSSPTLILSSIKTYSFDIQGISDNTSSALTTSGQLYTWGANIAGNLGDGTTIRRSSPVLIANNVKSYYIDDTQVSTPSCYYLTTSGQLYAWGANSNGCLGDGTTISRSSPVLVLGGYTWRAAQINFNSPSWGITTTNQMYMWGINSNGNLGVGDTVARSSPTLVLGGISWAQRSGPGGVSTTGQCYSWGQNLSGSLGVGDLLNRSSPVLLLGGIPASVQQITTTSQTLQVIPGVSYKIDCNFGIPMFGNFSIGSQPADFVTVSYNN